MRVSTGLYLSSVAGLLCGGYLTDIANWRLVFVPVLPYVAGKRTLWRGLLRSRIETRTEEVGRPFRLGLQSCLIDRRQDFGWQGTFGQRREIVP